jgi:acyl carrier protein
MVDMEQLVRRCLCDVMDGADLRPESLDLSRGLFDHYGLTSLNMVMLMTAVCEEGGIPLTAFTDRDIAGFKTPQDIVDTTTRLARAAGAAEGGQHVVG